MQKRPFTLSVSSYNTYIECGEKYRLHYVERLRPMTSMSWLTFGSAFDEGANALALKIGDPYLLSDKVLKRLFSEPTEFIKKDYDGELLSPEIKASLLERAKTLGYPGDSIDALIERCFEKGFKNISEVQREVLTLACYESLKVKLFLMLDAFQSKILPMIEKVEGVQQFISWTDEKGFNYRGVLDLPAVIKGHGPLIADNKTSSNPFQDYPEASVRNSMQLAVYAKVTGKTKGAYFVFDKQIKKNRIRTCFSCGVISANSRVKTCDAKLQTQRCGGDFTDTIKPECAVTIVIDDIAQEEMNICQSALTSVSEGIAAEVYPKNLKACRKTYGFGPSAYEVLCPYFNKCRKNSNEGLKQLPPEKEYKK